MDKTITSKEVAEWFEKRHDAILRDIRELSCTEAFKEENFERKESRTRNGKRTYHVEMTVKGFLFLVLGFTGERLAQRKEFYLNYFITNESNCLLDLSFDKSTFARSKKTLGEKMATLNQSSWHGMIFHPELEAAFNPMENTVLLAFRAYAQPPGNKKIAKFCWKKSLTADEYRAFMAKYPSGSIDFSSFFNTYVSDKIDKLLTQQDTVWMTMEEMENKNV